MADLEALETITALSFLTDDIEDGVDELGTFCVMALSPVVTGTSLSEDKVIRAEKLTEWSSTDGIHSAWLQIHENGTGDVSSSSCLVVVDVDSLELEIGITVICTGWVDSMLIRDDLPEFGTDLVTALTSLDVNDFSHCEFKL